jgi:hypothetical protein
LWAAGGEVDGGESTPGFAAGFAGSAAGAADGDFAFAFAFVFGFGSGSGLDTCRPGASLASVGGCATAASRSFVRSDVTPGEDGDPPQPAASATHAAAPMAAARATDGLRLRCRP